MVDVLAVLLSGLLWSFLIGDLSFVNFFIGSTLGTGLLALVRRRRAGSFPRRIVAVINFFMQFMWELVLANIIIAMLAFKVRPRFYPHIIAVPLTVTSDAAIALLSAAITLLPGTVALGTSEDKCQLYAHAIGASDIADARDSVLRIEKLILRFMT
ncbi:MAG: Na+/H+ antiporter subunit E [Deinococcota bacterium]